MNASTQTLWIEVTSKRDEVNQLLREIGQLLDDIADADADASWFVPAMPTDAVPDRLADLASHLQHMFMLEEDTECLYELFPSQPALRREFQRLHKDHGRLLDLLEEVSELAGSYVEPASTWNDVESHYRCFSRELIGHQRSEDAVLARR
jgi:hypothetical protein